MTDAYDHPREGMKVAEIPTRKSATRPPWGCGGCEKRWGGSNACHCSACHQTFSGLGGFDWHRTGDRCKGEPEILAAGYQLEQRTGYALWSKPMSEADRQRLYDSEVGVLRHG